MFGLFEKKCLYCRTKIDKDKEVKRDVKVPGNAGIQSKNFCSEEHADSYEQELDAFLKKPKKRGSCCG
ncbi:MAG: hypothetical protein ABH821_04870 [archaeon]